MMNLYWVMPKDHDLCAQAGDASAKYSGNQGFFRFGFPKPNTYWRRWR
jgi:hypothetical protein